jgi:hypothetical protein
MFKRFAAPVLFAVCVACSCVGSASAETARPGWELTARTFPTNLPPNGKGTIELDIVNVGEAASSGPVTVTDTLPEGVTATSAGELNGIKAEESNVGHELWNCAGNGAGGGVEGATVVTCTNELSGFAFAGGGGGPSEEGPNFQPELAINVSAGSNEAAGINRATIAGGGAAAPASTTDAVKVSSTPAGFEFTSWDGWFSNADGTPDTQAGSHPYETTFSFDLATLVGRPLGSPFNRLLAAGGELKNIVVDLPPGFVGDPNAVPQCTRQQLTAVSCPNASQIGFTQIIFNGGGSQIRDRVYNMVPPPGVPAEFAFQTVEGIYSFLDNSVRSGSDYGLTTEIDNAPTGRQIAHVVTTLWGVPGDPSHVIWRTASSAGGCSQGDIERIGISGEEEQECKPIGESAKPFLTLPTACGEPQVFRIRANTWQHPDVWAKAQFYAHDSNDTPTGFTGCEDLQFGPLISAAPDTAKADTPAGLTVDVKPSIGGLEDPFGVGTSDIQNTTVILPEGIVINPGQAAGLQACQDSQDGLTTETERAEGREDNGPSSCPLASKVGTLTIKTPLIEGAAEKQFEGNVYVMQSNPPELKLLLAASADGVDLKLVGIVHLDEHTGRLTTTFQGTPELPFTDLKLSFSGGPQAALDTPTQCGTYTTSADFTPWSSPFVADFLTNASFAITEGSNGAPCPSTPLPFAPSLIAGSTTDQAGGFTDFSLLLQAPDDQQRIEKLQFKVPEGLLGMISQVPLCPEPQAQAGTCSPASQIGHTVVASGPGPYPLVVPQPGQPPAVIYLTGPYKGAPYGLSIVVPLHVGPFVLQTQIVRAKIEVDPLTAQITVTTDPLPQVIDGVPTDLRTINAVIDRPGFMFNPTNCSPMSFSGAAYSAQGASTPISSHFQMGSCQALKFKPDFKVSTSGKTSRKNGASLDVKLNYPTGSLGDNQASSQSNIAQVKVDLPKQLPSRLTTLQKACPSATFAANPANCPLASRVGDVTAVTPVLPVKLTGPAYFVSYGGAKFPELVFVLQGYGVTVYVHAETFISKAGITSSTLRHVPDVPISSFELKLPQGPYSALAANGDLCTKTLKMPTAFTAQNGAVIHQSTPIGVTGCPKHKAHKVAKRKRKK